MTAQSAVDMPEQTFVIDVELAGQTLATALRALRAGVSWSQIKRLITSRRVEVNRTLCLNDARRLSAGDVVVVREQPGAPVPGAEDVRILHIDPDLIVIDKPAGIVSLRRDEEAEFSKLRKSLQPTLDELVVQLLPGWRRVNRGNRRPRKGAGPVVYPVHRLDRDTSGLMLFALSVRARDALIGMFSRHQVHRSYIAVVLGRVEEPREVRTLLVRDRGDGLRGSLPPGSDDARAKPAVTRVRPIEHIGDAYTVVECELETGRTHQVRIHLAEIGHMLCGEKLYTRPAADAPGLNDSSGAPRQALHSASLRFEHPISRRPLEFKSPLSNDLSRWLERLRQGR